MEQEPRFLADSMLGKLARWLRVMGYDAAYERAMDDGDLVERARAEGRILLTRDRKLMERRRLQHGFLVQHDAPMQQVRQVARAHGLQMLPDRILQRCLECNQLLESVSAELLQDRVPPYVLATQKCFSRCPGCQRIYWAATHVVRMRRQLEQVLRD